MASDNNLQRCGDGLVQILIRTRYCWTVTTAFMFSILALVSIAQAQNDNAHAGAQYLSFTAKSMGLVLEKLGPDAKARILGQWYLEGLREKSCIEGFFYEFRSDGTAYNETGGKSKYTVKSDSIEVTEAGSPLSIYQLSGNFYLPSRECALAKLVRGPMVKIPGVK